MVTSHLMGGLGNQLFQMSAAISFSIDNKENYYFSIKNSSEISHGKIEDYTSNIYRNINFLDDYSFGETYYEPCFFYLPLPNKKNMCLYGYFQSEKYFKNNEKKIKEIFSIDDNTNSYLLNKYGEILKNNLVTSVHIRRGDYLNLPNFHPVCSMEYYKNSMNMIQTDLFFIFSNDLEWCRQNFIGSKYIFIEQNKDYQDLYLMSMCNHNIIANSSFSWWGAWLNKNENKTIISPIRWFGKDCLNNTKDLIPDEWIKI